MKSQLHRFLPVLAASWLVFAGCEIETLEPERAPESPAGTVVINEVYTLPLSSPGRFNWIEFYNPTNDTVDLTNWTLEYRTYRLNNTAMVRVDTSGTFELLSYRVIFDAYGRFKVPVSGLSMPNPADPADPLLLDPTGLLTIVDNEDRLNDQTAWGPGDERFRRITTVFYGAVDSVDTLQWSDSLIVITAQWKSYTFLLDTTEQLVLRNAADEVVDVVRYGNYVYPGPGSDPYPGNISLGMIPAGESISRYANGYKTNGRIGNTARDFFVTDHFVRPIPHWYSQRHIE